MPACGAAPRIDGLTLPVGAGTLGRVSEHLAPGSRDIRLLSGWIAALAGAAACGAIIFLDVVVGPGRGPGSSTISAYFYTEWAWLFNAALVALVLGSVALIAGLLRADPQRIRSIGLWLLTVSAVGLALVLIFPKTDWSIGDSLAGRIHRIASLVAFLTAPLGMIALTRRSARPTGRAGHLAQAAFWLAIGALAWLTPMVVAAIRMFAGGPPWWRAYPLGLMERGIVGFEIAAMIALAISLALTARPPARSRTLAGAVAR